MNGLVVRIDQTPCRASYGLLTQSSLLAQQEYDRKSELLGSIGQVAADGDRLAKAYTPSNSMPEIASEKYDVGPPPDVVFKLIDRPIITWRENPGVMVDMFA